MEKGKRLFAGGVHPTHGEDKLLSRGKELRFYVPRTVRVSMKQGLGPACRLMVKPGDAVKQGQPIGEAAHFLSAAVHSPVTGTVRAVTETECEIAVSSCELPDRTASYNQQWADLSGYTREALIGLLEDGGLVGMGGAGFPTAAKYRTKDQITHVLINAAECEMYLTCDEAILQEFAPAFLNGARILKRAAGAEHAVICIEDNKPECMGKLRTLLEGHEDELTLLVLPTRYPQGGEKQLILAAMGVEIPSGKLPSSVGAIVSNVQTAKAAADMVLGGLPSVSRCITITGEVKYPGNYLVPVGTDIGELVGLAGDVTSKTNRVILGGPMTGRCLGENLDAQQISAVSGAAVSKVSGGLLVLGEYRAEETACIRCGSCAAACPIGLTPYALDAAVRKGNLETCQSYFATECIACGCCSYICPAHRELSFHTVMARDAVRAKMREEANRGK